MITGAEGSRHIVAGDQSETKPIASRLMFLRVILEVIPQVIGERVFVRHFGFEDAFELRPFRRKFRELKCAAFLEADEENAFAVLRHDALRIDDLRINLVAQRSSACHDDLKRAALVVAEEVFDVFQHEGGGPVVVDDFGEREKEVALFLVLEAVLAAEADFLETPARLKGWQGKPAQRMSCAECRPPPRNGCRRAASRRNWRRRSARLFVPVGGENALAPGALEGDAETANAAEEVNEAESVGAHCVTRYGVASSRNRSDEVQIPDFRAGEVGADPALRLFSRSRVHSLAEFRRGEAQRLGESGDVLDAGIVPAAFDVADVGGIEPGFLGEFFLGECAGFAVFADVQPERRKNSVTFRHDS